MDAAELKSFGFFPRAEVDTRTTAKLARRLGYAVDARSEGILIELENGRRRL